MKIADKKKKKKKKKKKGGVGERLEVSPTLIIFKQTVANIMNKNIASITVITSLFY